MTYDFDTVIERRHTDSVKWDTRPAGLEEVELLPLWVADMDFACPPAVAESLRKRAEHPVFGYSERPASYYRAVQEWMQKRFDWPIRPDWIAVTPGVVPALNLAIQAFSANAEGVVIQPPVYYPFISSITNNDRRVIHNPLKLEDNRYVMDFDGLEKAIDSGTRLLVLCHPHNPVGRVWKSGELLELSEICKRHDLLIVSDEIHADLIMPGFRHHPLACLCPQLADRIITCTSPSKTFNIAGLQVANIIIPNPDLRQRFLQQAWKCGTHLSNPFAIIAAETAYRHGEAWLQELLTYLFANYSYVKDYLAGHLPRIRPVSLEGTYLLWLDFRELGMTDQALQNKLLHEARLWLDPGPIFGPGGAGFLRLNLACPRSRLQEAMGRLSHALASEYLRN